VAAEEEGGEEGEEEGGEEGEEGEEGEQREEEGEEEGEEGEEGEEEGEEGGEEEGEEEGAAEVAAEAEGLQLHLSSSSSTGYKGVYQRGGRFSAERNVAGRLVTIGTFDSAVEAAVEYARAVGPGPTAAEYEQAERRRERHRRQEAPRWRVKITNHPIYGRVRKDGFKTKGTARVFRDSYITYMRSCAADPAAASKAASADAIAYSGQMCRAGNALFRREAATVFGQEEELAALAAMPEAHNRQAGELEAALRSALRGAAEGAAEADGAAEGLAEAAVEAEGAADAFGRWSRAVAQPTLEMARGAL